MVRISYDYDLMTVLARHLWHLRDELDVTSQTDKTFAAGDIGPRRETAEALEDFYGAWQKSFRDAWQVMTDLGDLLDRAGKAFYDQDASLAAGAAQQITDSVRGDARRQNETYNQRLNDLRRGEKIRTLEGHYKVEQARLKKERDALQVKQRKIDERLGDQQKRQEALDKEHEELSKKQEPLLKVQEELQLKQQRLQQEEKDLLAEREAELQAKRAELQKEYDALREGAEPLAKEQEEILRKQQEIWRDEKALREELDAAFQKKADALELDQQAYDTKQGALDDRQDALWRERDALLSRGNVTRAEIDAWQGRQDALQKERDDLWETEGKGLEQRWDALEQEQKDQQKAFDPFRERQRELDEERKALVGRQEPLTERQAELLKKQEDLRALELSTQQEVEDTVRKAREDLDAQREDLQKQQAPLDKEWKDLRTRQEDLWQDQVEAEEDQAALRKEEEPLQKRQEHLQKYVGEKYDELRDYKWDPESGEGDPLLRRRDGPDDLGGPAYVPNGHTIEDDNSTTTVSYELDENYEIKLDKNGEPVETTTTVTNKNTGLTYSETYRRLPSGDDDSVTTIRNSDGSVTKIYTDGPVRWVTDETGKDTLQIWVQRDGEWVLTMDKETYFNSPAGKEDAQQQLDRPPAYLAVENPLVGPDGRPAGSYSEGETTQLQDGVTRTNYTDSDGSVLKVVTIYSENEFGRRLVVGANNEIEEIWLRREDGTWYLKDSTAQHERYSNLGPTFGYLHEPWR
ncbi:hypothetical protein [Streptomyces sp. NPDC002845]